MSYSEVYKLPVSYRRWYLRRLVRHFEDKSKKLNQIQNPKNDSKDDSKLDMFSRFENQVKNKLS